MHLTGYVRKLDVLGRITIPAELRRHLEVEFQDRMEIFLDSNNQLVLRKYEPIDCDSYTGELGDMNELIEFEGKKVTKGNVRKMAELAGLNLKED